MGLKPGHLASTGLIRSRFCFSRRQFALLALGVLMLVTLACRLLDGASPEKPRRIVIRSVLPTLTPTAAPAPNSAAPAALAPGATVPSLPPAASPAPTPAEGLDSSEQPPPAPFEVTSQPPANETVNTSPAEPTIAPGSASWTFAGVEVYRDEFEAGLALYGDAVNETGSTQELNVITATFYDGQGRVIDAAGSAIDYWPIDVIPAGARLPFGILAPDVQNVADFELNIEAQPGSQNPHQNFEVSNLEQQQAELGYCLTGQVRNLGNPLQEYLIVMAVLYDSQDHVIKFGEYYAPDPTVIRGDQLELFEICVDSVSRPVARHELRVWGE